MSELFTSYYASPIGPIKISVTDTAVTGVVFCNENDADNIEPGTSSTAPLIKLCIEQLDACFKGDIRNFDLPISQSGTTFQQTVWRELGKIPYGATISYLDLARKLGNVKSIRAAASSNGKNKIAVIIPCHRVIGSNQQLVGYAGGLSKKRWLLEHEQKFAHGKHTLF